MEDNNQKNKSSLWITCGLYLCLFMGTIGWLNKDYLSSVIKKAYAKTQKKEEWITIFVHGTFNCQYGLLSLPAVVTDTIGKTVYKSLIESKRKDASYYVEQAILQRGLIKITPSYDLHVTNGQRLSAYPLTQAFQDFVTLSPDNQENNTYYTFGWSGLLSQKQRRIEAIRFYNIINTELERYHCIGKYPKIRLVAHSHGGNLCLNLGAINEILSLASYDDLEHQTPDIATNETLASMFQQIKLLPNQENARNAKKFKYLDYVPTAKLAIDELILYGNPVQVETEPLYFSPTFKKIYHFYSDADAIQPFDFISTKQKSSRTLKRTAEGLPLARAFPDLIQGKIILNHHRKTKTINNKNCDLYKQYNVGHKDLWLISWHETNNPFAPLPIYVFTPLFLAALKAQEYPCQDVDINIKITRKHLKIQVSPRAQDKLKTLVSLPKKTLEDARKNLRRWDPYHTIKA